MKESADYRSESNAYSRLLDPFQAAEIDILLDKLHPQQMLEVGSATGSLLRHIESPRRDVVGVDINEQALKKGPIGNVAQADIASLPFPNETFDFVIATHVLEHVPDLDGSMAELSRVTHTGGQIFLAYPREPILGIFASWAAMNLYGNPFAGARIHLRHLRPHNFDDMNNGLKHEGSRFSLLPLPQYFTLLSKVE